MDRGPRIVDTLKTVMVMSLAGAALCVPGNHDIKLKRKLEGRDVAITHGLDRTLTELERETPEFRAEVQKFIDGLVSHYVFDEGRLVVAHAGMKEEMQGRGSAKVGDFRIVRRDHRIWFAGSLQLGLGISRTGQRRVWPHAGARAGVAESDDQHRHRLRLWWSTQRVAVAREGARLAAGTSDVRGACSPVLAWDDRPCTDRAACP